MGRFSSCPPSYLFALPRRTAVSSSHVSLPPPPLHHAVKLYVSLPGPLPQPPPFKQPSAECLTSAGRGNGPDPDEKFHGGELTVASPLFFMGFWALLGKKRS